MTTYPAVPDIPTANSDGDQKICGDANPTHYIEPNVDGSINAVLLGSLTLDPAVTLLAGTEQIGHVITDPTSVTSLAAGTEVIGHVIVDSGADVALASGTTVGLEAGAEVIGHVIVDSGAVTLGAGTASIGVVHLATSSTAVDIGTEAAPQVIKSPGGYLSGAIVTAIDSPPAAVSIYDSPTNATGKLIGYIPDTATAGSYWPFNMPASIGITVGKVLHSHALTVAFS
jgi:hypothetical protein